MSKKLLYIVNPLSGYGYIKYRLLSIIDIFIKNGYEVTVHTTQARNDAAEKAAASADDYDMIVCSGGDGTLNEVITGLMRKGKKYTLGYIPAGTANDFASSLGIPKVFTKAAEVAVTGFPFPCDIGSFNDVYFTYVAAFGAFTDVAYQTPQQMKSLFGSLAYVMEGIKRVNSLQCYNMKIDLDLDGKVIDDRFIYGMFSNSRSIGGMKGLTGSDVKMNDGLFEYLLIREPRNARELNTIVNSLAKRDFDNPMFISGKTTGAEIVSFGDAPWTLDGEFGGTPANVMLKANREAIKIMTF